MASRERSITLNWSRCSFSLPHFLPVTSSRAAAEAEDETDDSRARFVGWALDTEVDGRRTLAMVAVRTVEDRRLGAGVIVGDEVALGDEVEEAYDGAYLHFTSADGGTSPAENWVGRVSMSPINVEMPGRRSPRLANVRAESTAQVNSRLLCI